MITLKGISRRYASGGSTVNALTGIDLTIEKGDYVAIVGHSGSGKSTLMHILGMLDRPTEGTYMFAGQDVTQLDENQLAVVRNTVAGFIFQQFYLLPRMSAVKNVQLPLVYAGKHDTEAQVLKGLAQVGLSARSTHMPNQLSGGEQQRVAIARALANNPLVILADEPTGNLDSKSEQEIVGILEGLNKEGKTIIVVTHEMDIAAHANRVIQMRDGRILSDIRNKPIAVPATKMRTGKDQ